MFVWPYYLRGQGGGSDIPHQIEKIFSSNSHVWTSLNVADVHESHKSPLGPDLTISTGLGTYHYKWY